MLHELRSSYSSQTAAAAILTAPDGLFVEQRTGRIEFPEISTKILEKVVKMRRAIMRVPLSNVPIGHRILLLQNSKQQHQQPA